MNINYWAICISFIFTHTLTAQQNKTKNLTHSKLDKVVLKEMQIDTLVWYFEDFKESIVIDSTWQKLLSDQQLFRHQQNVYANESYIETVDYELSTDTLKHRLSLLNAKTPLDISYSKDLESVIQYYLKREKETTEKLIRLSDYYFPMFESIFDKHNLPLEIKYFVLV